MTKTHDGGLRDMHRDRKICWIYLNEGNVNRPTSSQWYSDQVVGRNTISKVVRNLMEKAGINGFFTNHSARRTGGTRLFRAGVQCKLVKEMTGHTSDAIDQYQLISDAQRQIMSKVLTCQHCTQVKVVEAVEPKVKKVKIDDKDEVSLCEKSCTWKCQSGEVNTNNIGSIVEKIVKSQGSGDGKTVIKIQLEISKE